MEREIPDYDSTGIRDTIFVPAHVQIQDINFYIGINNPPHAWAEEIMIDVFSPGRQRVGINAWQGRVEPVKWYDIWCDREQEEDGPGYLEDYAGQDAYGPREMFCFDAFPTRTLIWHTWHIEIFGDPKEVAGQGNGLIPAEFTLSGIHPNPFNSTASIEYGLPVKSEVCIQIFDILERKVRLLLPGRQASGYHSVSGTART
jgi:hypothetical protein